MFWSAAIHRSFQVVRNVSLIQRRNDKGQASQWEGEAPAEPFSLCGIGDLAASRELDSELSNNYHRQVPVSPHSASADKKARREPRPPCLSPFTQKSKFAEKNRLCVAQWCGFPLPV